MILLLAAVPEETCLLREALAADKCRSVHGLSLWSGQLHGRPVALAHTGVGKAAAAAAAATLLAAGRYRALWLFGCGGACPGSGLALGDLALADAELFADEGSLTPDGFRDLHALGVTMRCEPERYDNRWPVDTTLHDRAWPILQQHAEGAGRTLRRGLFVTVSTCTGTSRGARELVQRTGGLCENMEGAAVALVCNQFGLPLLEVRGISNRVEDRDPARWDLPAGMQAAQQAILALLPALGGDA
ncbi:MAG: futalosine hydrolase [Desulfuromonadales bacterium]|nr:futalosine hydrolase [Desulfuromonadales bacterium]